MDEKQREAIQLAKRIRNNMDSVVEDLEGGFPASAMLDLIKTHLQELELLTGE